MLKLVVRILILAEGWIIIGAIKELYTSIAKHACASSKHEDMNV